MLLGGVTILASLSPLAASPYSDANSILFVAVAVYAYLRSFDQNNTVRQELAWLALCIVSAVFGALIKPTLLVLVVAVIVLEVIRVIRNHKRVRQALCAGCLSLLALVLAFWFVRPFASSLYIGTLDEEAAVSWQHYFFMGLNPETNGDVSAADIRFSISYDTREERNAADFDAAQARLSELADGGKLTSFYMKKCLLTYLDGTFSYLGFVNPNRIGDARLGTLGDAIRGVYLFHEENFDEKYDDGLPIRDVEQCAWLALLMLMPFLFVVRGRLSETFSDYVLFVAVVLIGLFLFQIAFETRTRYLFPWIPVFVTAAMCGWEGLKFIAASFTRKIREWQRV